ncbi:uncharacterized protein PGTG_02887 [Puccinia graminis f. sp. tritici CRL 75-36-700-3]|uniref:Uncharacterized protein n=1 Tax=Puccinia graminis f. sp. tritici (strain CRL 75-36-700-3 / race SCCL) TaxID=418459 RepID=E3JWM1_PUCGT|nr:uncharacterized protein PGTG_02887 [Puccinia graminis f. sp. tritici CRL 75-36-700-3]EFP76446.2 hypothetical protein PGTG_02887 [Puccinia graminis f. sp. tritici CRL 75-36-700-3]
MAPITIQCLLFLENDHNLGPLEPIVQWTKVTSPSVPTPWKTNLQSMDWKQFQDGALIFLSRSTAYLLPAMQYANIGKTISWFASIGNHPKYRSPHGIRLKGQLNYLAFGAAARAAYPAEYEWRLTKIRGNGAITAFQLTELLSQSTKSNESTVTRDAEELSSSDSGSDYPLALTDRHVSKHQRYNKNSTLSLTGSSDQEIVGLPKRLFLPDIQADVVSNPQINAKVPRTPMAPPRRDMDDISMENYLDVAKVPKEDMRTRERLMDHGITHWSFFRSCDEDDLKALGFLAGVARLLWEGVPRLHEYCDGLEENDFITSQGNHFITSPTPSPAGPSHTK